MEIDLFKVLQIEDKNIFVGFTGSTGGLSQIHSILNWKFVTDSM